MTDDPIADACMAVHVVRDEVRAGRLPRDRLETAREALRAAITAAETTDDGR